MLYNVRKLTFSAAMMAGVAVFNAQSVQDGVNLVDSHKYAQARGVFEKLMQANPKDANNFFYMGNTYLTQFEPNFDKATEYFQKGLAQSSNSHLNKIGIATVKLGKGDRSGIAEIQKVVSDSREKDAEVLYRAAEALTLFEKTNAPDLAIDYLNKAIERSKGGVAPQIYYSLGDAYRLKKEAGNAMNAYEKALAVSRSKASVFTRMATLWMAANQWKLADENITKAISADPSYAPAYKALAAYKTRFQENAAVTQALINYAKYADEDPDTQLEISKMYFVNNDYAQSQKLLGTIFSKVEDPIKYKLRAYNEYKLGGDMAQAKADLNQFKNSVTDKSRIQPADTALEGLFIAIDAKNEADVTRKAELLAEANQKIAVAKNIQDQTLDWDMEFAKINGGAVTAEMVEAGPQSPKIQELKTKLATNPKDANVLVELGTAYQEAQNWNGAIFTWDKMIALAPDWEYSFYAKGVAYQQLGKHDMAELSYQKYIDTVAKKSQAEQDAQKQSLSYAYFLVAHYNQEKNLPLAKEYAAKAVMLNPSYEDAVKLNTALQAK